MAIENTSNHPGFIPAFGGDSSVIESQERAGQQELVNSSQLPKRGIEEACKEITVIGDSKEDALFVDVKLPKGWKIIEDNPPYWSALIDEKEKVRAKIFYKAAFYDRRAFIKFMLIY